MTEKPEITYPLKRRTRPIGHATGTAVSCDSLVGPPPSKSIRNQPAPREARDNGDVTEREHDWPVSCSNCGASRNNLDDGVPCPSCGSTALTVHVSFHDEVAVTESFGITAAYGKQRPWSEKWKEVEAAYKALTEVYSGRAPRGGGAEEWRSAALSFFRTCHELPEAILSDSGVSAVIKRSVRRTADRSAALRLVADVDNTRKHGGRDPSKCYAHIGEVSWGDHATPTMTILRQCPNSPVERFDVLASATAAMDRWRGIFSRRRLVL